MNFDKYKTYILIAIVIATIAFYYFIMKQTNKLIDDKLKNHKVNIKKKVIREKKQVIVADDNIDSYIDIDEKSDDQNEFVQQIGNQRLTKSNVLMRDLDNV